MNIVPYLAAPDAAPGVFRVPTAIDDGPLLQFVRDRGLRLYRLDLAGVADKSTLLAHFARTLRFPEHFGANWDALEDCLTDLAWDSAQGYVLLLEHADALFGQEALSAPLIDLLNDVATWWDEQGVPFWVIVVDPAAVATRLPRLDAART